MKMPGPFPMRTDDLSRAADANRKGSMPLTKGMSIPCEPLAANPKWDHIALQTYESMTKSGMAQFFEASDWAMLYLLCDELSHLRGVRETMGKTPAIIFQTVVNGLSALGMTEGERRRMRIELEEGKAEEADATLTVISDYRQKLNEALAERDA